MKPASSSSMTCPAGCSPVAGTVVMASILEGSKAFPLASMRTTPAAFNSAVKRS